MKDNNLEQNEQARGINVNTVYCYFDDASFYDWLCTVFDTFGEFPSMLYSGIINYVRTHAGRGDDSLPDMLAQLFGHEISFFDAARFCTNELLTEDTISRLDGVYCKNNGEFVYEK